jgi:phosphoesterase RecJ-like protein
VCDRAEGDYEVLFVLECNNLERTGISNLECYPIVNIDHHPKNDHFGKYNWVDPSAAAVGELVFSLIKSLLGELTPEIATNLYVAILTDTGSFQFSNTSAKTFSIAAELVDAGADPAEIAQAVLMNQDESRIRLLARVLQTLEFDTSRRIAWIHLDRRMLLETGASASDTEGIVNYPLSVEGVLVSAFFREEQDGSYRVSLRSKDGSDVSAVAEQFGGGGHENAAGLSANGSLAEVKAKVLERLLALLD